MQDYLIPPLRFLTYVGYWARHKRWPSRMQRLHMQGDPTGEVQRYADTVIAEMKAEGTWE